MKVPIELSFGSLPDIPEEAGRPDQYVPTAPPDATTVAAPPEGTGIKPPEDLVPVDEQTGVVVDEVLPPPTLDDFETSVAPPSDEPVNAPEPQRATIDVVLAPPTVGAAAEIRATQLPEKISKATGELLINNTVEIPAGPAPDETKPLQPPVQPAPTDAEEAKDGIPWWKVIHKAPKREDAPADKPTQPPEDAEPTPPPSGPADGGGDEPPQPPRPPEGGDESGDDGDEEARRRLTEAMDEYSRIIRPVTSVVEKYEWYKTATRADKDLHEAIDQATGSLTQSLLGGNYESLKNEANKMADRLLKQGDSCSVGKVMAVHMTVSARTSRALTDAVRRSPFKTHRAENNATYFLSQFANALAWRMPEATVAESPNPSALYDEARERSSDRLASGTGETKGWVDAKLHTFNSALTLRRNADYQVSREVPLETASLKELRRYNNELARQVDAKRQYTIKPAVHEGEHVAWSVHDFVDMRADLRAIQEAENSSINSHEWASKMRLVALEHDPDDEDAARHIIVPQALAAGDDQLVEAGEKTGRVCYMDNKGELYADWTGNMPLKDLYERHGKAVNYEALRQYLVGTYFRLTVPVEVEREAQHATEQVLGREANQLPQGRDPGNREVVHDLHLPRLRVLGKYSKQQIAEREQAELRVGEVIDKDNNVVGHTRKLNPQYRASQAARDEAAQYGITLPERGMTFVKAHWHPNAGRAGMHRAKGENGEGRYRRS